MSQVRDVSAVVAELREDYRRALPARVERIAGALSRARAADAGALREAIADAHRIRGTAGSIGFPEISVVAAELEEAAEALQAGGPSGEGWAAIDAASEKLRALVRGEG